MNTSSPTPEPLEAQHPDLYGRCVIQAIRCPTYVEGGDYCVTAAVTLPDGTARTSTIRYHAREDADQAEAGDVVYLALPRS